MKEDILTLLKNEDNDQGLFYSKQSTSLQGINVTLHGVGELVFPLTQQAIGDILQHAKKAKFGKADQTIYDASVRDTHEIPQDALTVNIDNIDTLMENISKDMGIKAPLKLQPHLHNMLVYQKGQFFKPHQDSEKLEGMVATMIVVLPSAHIGGTLNVTHKNKKKKFKSEAIYPKKVSYFAFYADCEHEVDPVTEGYRVVLTYNLVLEKTEDEKNIEFENYNALKEKVVDYMKNNERFTYFLDHEYTEHSLRFRYLKGNDRLNVGAFCRIAKEAGYRTHLSLVDICKTYDAPRENKINDLIDDTVALYHWIDSSDRGLEYDHYRIDEEDVFQLKSTESFEPKDQEYEGYLGNYGCTMDYWYNRAAFIMWKEEDQLRFEYKLMPKISLNNLEKMIEDKKPKQDVASIIQAVYPVILSQHEFKFKDIARILAYAEDMDLAKEMLKTFKWKDIQPENIEALKKVENAFGEEFLFDIIKEWGENKDFYISYSGYSDMLDLLQAINKAQLGADATEYLIAKYANYFFQLETEVIDKNEEKSVSYFIAIIHQFLDIAQKFPNILKLIQTLILKNNYPLHILFKIEKGNASFIKEEILKKANHILERGRPEINDWEIDKEISCTCDDCQAVNAFLKSNTDQIFVLARAQYYRDHVGMNLRSLYLPIKMSTLKHKSPHSLVIEKQEETYKIRQALYDQVSAYLSR